MKKEEYRALPTHKKVIYLIKTYTVQVLLGGILLFLLGSYVYEEYIKPPVAMNVEMINACRESPDGESFNAFFADAGYHQERAEISKAFQLGNEKGDLRCDPSKLLLCTVATGKTDLFFWDTDEMEDQLIDMALMDLRDVLPPELILKYEDKLLYTGPILTGGYPYGLVLEDNAWVQSNHYYEDCVVGVSRTAKDLNMVREFLAYILR